MALTLTGKITHILDTESGNGQKGEWKKQVFAIQTEEEYSKTVAFTAWNDKVDLLKEFKTGRMVKVSFNPESREHEGKFYTDLKAWKIE